MTLDQYEDVRAVPVRFFTIRGHQDIATEAGAARVVEERGGYVVVDKIGVAGDVAQQQYGALTESPSPHVEVDTDTFGRSAQDDP